MRYPPALLLVVLATLSGCTDTADTFPMNDAANGLGSPGHPLSEPAWGTALSPSQWRMARF